MALIHVYLLIICCMCRECYPKSDRFTKHPAFADQMCPADQVQFQTVTCSAVSCVQQCGATPGCSSLVYLQGNKTCFGIKSENPFSVTSSPLPGAAFYVPINMDLYEDVGEMKLRFVLLQKVPHREAQTACSPAGALVKLDTPDKVEALKAYLLDENNGYQKNFWVQGQYDVTDEVWEYDDGTPLLQGYWHPSAPDSNGAYCVMLWSAVDFAYDDYWCNQSVGFICEYQN